MLKLDYMETDLYIAYKGTNLAVSKFKVAGAEVYRVVFPDNRPPLIVTIAEKRNGKPFWTSIPEGRQEEAEEIGPLIVNAFNLF